MNKALIPVAGKGTRLAPLTSVVPKALLPLVDARRRVRAILHVIVAEALAAGIEQVAVVVSPGQQEPLERYFAAADAAEGSDLAARITYLLQETPAGFGDAVARGEGFAAGEPLLVMLGDHVHLPATGKKPCAAQVVEAFEQRRPVAMIGMQDVDAEELPRVGAAGGQRLDGRVYRCTDFIEKPDASAARSRLRTQDLPEGRYLAHAGLFVVGGEIFDCLRATARRAAAGREVEFADALSELLGRHPEDYLLYRIDGRAHDTGTPAGYTQAVAAWRESGG